MTSRSFAGVLVIACCVLIGCGDGSSAAVDSTGARSDREFCESMEHLIVLLAPSGPTSPQGTEAAFTEGAGWFAYDDDVQFFAESGFNLDVVFSTTEGRVLAIETSHSLTVPIVEHMTNECGLSFGDES